MVVVKPLFEAQQLAGLAHKLRTLILHIIRRCRASFALPFALPYT